MARRSSTLPAVSVLLLTGLLLLAVTAGGAFAAKLSYTVELSREKLVVVTELGLTRVGVSGEGYARLSEEGYPDLPFRVVNVLLPEGETVESVRFVPSDGVVVASGIEMTRLGAMLSEDGKAGRGVAMAGTEGGVYPEAAGRYLGTGYLHGRGIASIAVYPVRVEDSSLVLTERVTVEVETKVSGERPVVRERYREGFGEGLRETLEGYVVNAEMEGSYRHGEVRVEKKPGGFQPTSYPSLEGSAVDYVIITTDALSAEYQRLADWKTEKGVATVVRTVEWIEAHTRNGVDLPETMRFFIQDAYAKWGITYVLLGGDTDILPPRYAMSRFYLGGTELPVDMYFACLDGSWNDNHDKYWGEGFNVIPYDNPDLYAEVYQGRIPVSTVSLVSLMIDKIIQYETPCDPSYLDRYMFLAEVLFPVDWKTPDPISLNGADFSEFIYATTLQGKPIDVVKMYETDWLYANAVPENKQAALDSMVAGFNHINHIGHGFRFNMSVADASIQVGDADALTNGCKLFNLYMLNCTAAAFDFYCLAEHFLTCANGGAATVVGANNSAFPNASGNYMNEYYDLLFDRDVVHIGETFARSRLPRTPVASAGDNVDLWTHYIYTLLADPEMPLYTGSVGTVNVVHVPSVGLGTTSILVNVTSGGGPVDSAVVCLSKDGDDYEHGATNALGNVTLEFTAETAGTIKVVVTGRNLARDEGTITVNPAVGAYVNYASLTVDDNMSGGTFGNSDGVVDAGETMDLTISLKNTGGAATGTVSLVLRSNASGVAIPDSTANVGTIGVGQTKAATDPVRVTFDKVLVDETAVEFQLVIKEGGVTKWSDRFRKEIHAPELELTTLRIFDGAPLGNGNGVNEAGEQFRLYYGLKNYGTGLASGLTATLKDLDGMFVFYDSTDTYGNLGSFVEGENVDGFHVKETDVSAEHDLEIVVTDLFNRAYRDTIELRRPLAPTGLVFDASLGSDRLELSWTKSASTDVVRYNVYHSLTTGGPYTQVSVDPIDHAVYLDTGLSSSTVYFYVVTAVDVSGNESAWSVQGSASTNPPQMPGFPVQMKTQTTSSPAVGDIDGDGDLEIVVGNQWIYAWHHDGLELRDGDGDPQSWGVLTTVGSQFTAPVALARIDNNPGLDILAADLITKKVYCVNHNGDAVSGWPQQALNDFRAAPVAGDLDGDGFYEVIAVDSKGIIYVWHANGTEWLDGDANPATTGVFYVTTPVSATLFETPTVCDIDGDHKDEIIVGTRADSVWVFNGNRSRVPGWPVALNFDIAGSICAGDVDGDGQIELLVQSKGAAGQAYLFNHDGTLCAGWPKAARMDVFFSPSPALADFDNDGKLECVVYTWDGSQAKIAIFTYLGANYTGWPKVVGSSYTDNSSLTVADVNGDGGLDIILGNEAKYIYAWDINGTLIPGFPVQAKDAVRSTPFLTDVDLDGDIDMVVHCWDQNIYAWDLPGTYNNTLAPWPTLQANSHRNGCYEFEVPTGIESAAFLFKVGRDGVNLTWMYAGSPGERFDVLRSVAENGVTTGFVTVATNVVASYEGTVRFEDRAVEMGRGYVYQLVGVDNPGDVYTTGPIYIPAARAELAQNHPNPFNPTTEIAYVVPEGGSQHVALVVYDVSGARVRTLVDRSITPGRHTVVWDGRDSDNNTVGTGVYFYRMQLKGFTETKKMLLLK